METPDNTASIIEIGKDSAFKFNAHSLQYSLSGAEGSETIMSDSAGKATANILLDQLED